MSDSGESGCVKCSNAVCMIQMGSAFAIARK